MEFLCPTVTLRYRVIKGQLEFQEDGAKYFFLELGLNVFGILYFE